MTHVANAPEDFAARALDGLYLGTVRMGDVDDGTSVCDSTSRVWETSNVFVAGNGVIPTSTACNPTLTSVALALLGAEEIVRRLEGAIA